MNALQANAVWLKLDHFVDDTQCTYSVYVIVRSLALARAHYVRITVIPSWLRVDDEPIGTGEVRALACPRCMKFVHYCHFNF